jgi:VanZ family protein
LTEPVKAFVRKIIHRALTLRAGARRGFLCAVSKLKWFLKYWLPVLLWATVIFSASGDKKSVHHSSRIIEPIVRWLFPNASDDTVWATVFAARKGAHLTEYALFATLLWRAMRGARTGWTRRHAAIAWFAATGFAMTDEIHQAFVPGRQGSPWDVLLDSAGAAGGLFVLWYLGRWRKKWGNASQQNMFSKRSP